MITRPRMISVIILILASAVAGVAQDDRVLLRPVFKPGQEVRYAVHATVETVVRATGSDGITNLVRRELDATLLIRTLAVAENGLVEQEATIEEVAARATVNGSEKSPESGALSGQTIAFTLDQSGNLVNCAIPKAASDLGVAELLFTLTGWLPHDEKSSGDTWEAAGQGPLYSGSLSDIAKSSKTAYKLPSISGRTAVIEGRIALGQSGASVLTTSRGAANVNVIASGKGSTRFEYDAEQGHILSGATEVTFEGRLANVTPLGEGNRLRSREGSVTEVSRYSIRLVQ